MKPGTLSLPKVFGILIANLLFFAANTYAQRDTTLNQPNQSGTFVAPHSITLAPGFSTAPGQSFRAYIVPPSLLNCVPLAATPSSNQNYIMTLVPRAPFTDASTLMNKNTCEVMQTVQYFDGLGRPLQTVQVKGNQDANRDIVIPFAYDQFGREAAKYSPYTTADGVTGSYRPDALTGPSGYTSSAQYQFYQRTGQNYGVNTAPISGIGYEPSPLNRVVEKGEPGADWQLGHQTIKTDYATNDGTNYYAKQFGVNLDPATGAPTLLDQGYYVTNHLYVTVTKNENWKPNQTDLRLNTIEEYTDYEKQVVLKRTYNLNPTNNTVETLSIYYVYNDLGQLSFVLPAKAEADASTAANPISQTVLDNICYQYTYDERGRVISKKLPGKSVEYSVYDKLDQLVGQQDGNQRVLNEWVVLKYDALGRVILTGIFTNNNTALSPTAFKTNVYGQTQAWEEKDNSQAQAYTMSHTFPHLIDTVLTVNYYDDYNIINLPYDYHSQYSQMTRSLLTASKVNVIGTQQMLWTVNYYDDKGNITNVYEQHYLGGSSNFSIANYDHITNTYNFNNEITHTVRQHYKNNSGTSVLALTVSNGWLYDHMGRKRQAFEQINGGDSVIVNQFDYNEIGEVMVKHLHKVDGASGFSQDVTYGYNERGWLKDVSAPLFAMQLAYNNGSNPRYNGSIVSQSWGLPSALNKNYAYTYDNLDRLTSGVSNEGYTEKDITYDKVGNIQSLTRLAPSSPTANPYTYSYYANSNNLSAVSGLTTSNYTYDNNGNIKHDGRNNVNIEYNNMNLPKKVAGAHTIQYTYDATGKKLRRVSQLTGTTDYINGLQYDQNSLSFIQTEEGRAIPDGTSFNYEYYLADHLGNTRITFDTKSGHAAQKQANNYYPFGKNIFVGTIVSPQNNYLYNRKELQEELGEYDYGARFYDAEIGRFTTMDRFSEKYADMSPYQYAALNPMKNIDMNGDSVWVTEDKNKKGKIIGYTTHITGRVMNAATRGISANDVANGINSNLNAQSYTDPKTGLTYKFDSQYRAADNISQVKSSDHLVVVVDNITGGADKNLGGGPAGGVAEMFGKVGYAGYQDITTEQAIDIAVHEIGHNLGLGHASKDAANYAIDPMGYAASANGKPFTGSEMMEIKSNVRMMGSYMNDKHYNQSVVVRGDHYQSFSSNEKPMTGNWYPGVKMPLVIKNGN